MHIAVVHVVEMASAPALTLIRQLYVDLSLTVRLFYQKIGKDKWLDVIIVCEGTSEHVDALIASLRSHDQGQLLQTSQPSQIPFVLRAPSVLLRQWTYILTDQNDADAPPQTPSSPQSEARFIGPTGLRGAAYEDMKLLAEKHLKKLGLGCDWHEVLMAAELSTAIANRVSAPTTNEVMSSKRSRHCCTASGGKAVSRGCHIEKEMGNMCVGSDGDGGSQAHSK